MEMKQCLQGGHYYDASVHSECPYCNSANIGVTMSSDIGRTIPLPPAGDGRTRSTGGVSDDGRTVVVVRKELGINPVVGWLVCTNGSEKGRDYRIHSGNNYIGRGENMDICIRGDDTISREANASISFDARDKIYYFSPCQGQNIVRLNDKAIFATAEIHAYDTVEIGMTKLVFIPLCGDKFEWA